MTLASRGCLILPFVVYFRGDQALLVTQNIDQIKAPSRAGHSTVSPHLGGPRKGVFSAGWHPEWWWLPTGRENREAVPRSHGGPAVQPGLHPSQVCWDQDTTAQRPCLPSGQSCTHSQGHIVWETAEDLEQIVLEKTDSDEAWTRGSGRLTCPRGAYPCSASFCLCPPSCPLPESRLPTCWRLFGPPRLSPSPWPAPPRPESLSSSGSWAKPTSLLRRGC